MHGETNYCTSHEIPESMVRRFRDVESLQLLQQRNRSGVGDVVADMPCEAVKWVSKCLANCPSTCLLILNFVSINLVACPSCITAGQLMNQSGGKSPTQESQRPHWSHSNHSSLLSMFPLIIFVLNHCVIKVSNGRVC